MSGSLSRIDYATVGACPRIRALTVGVLADIRANKKAHYTMGLVFVLAETKGFEPLMQVYARMLP
jgi:hydrogenase/urease accessory protein HupE